jgi:hypothetical protein
MRRPETVIEREVKTLCKNLANIWFHENYCMGLNAEYMKPILTIAIAFVE